MINQLAKLAVMIALALLVFNIALSQSRARDQRIIRFARNLNVARLDRRLPSQSFEKWLRNVVGKRADIRWEVDDCGEQDGNLSNPMNRNPPLCANARTKMADGNELGIAIAVGSHKRGISGKPVVFYTHWGRRDVPERLLELAAFVRTDRQ